MSTRVVVDDDEQQIADMLKQVRRLRSRLASVTPRGGHDTFTAAATPATTYQLSVIPILGTCLMALNGHVQREGTDYSCDYSTGLVTVSATQASGDKVVFRYLITDWLVARSLTPDNGFNLNVYQDGTLVYSFNIATPFLTGTNVGMAQAGDYDSSHVLWDDFQSTVVGTSIADTFNRADNATSLGTASDGGTWTLTPRTTWGIASNRAYKSSNHSGLLDRFGNSAYNGLYRDSGSVACDVTFKFGITGTVATTPGFLFAYDAGVGTSGNAYLVTLSGTTGVLRKATPSTDTQLGTNFTISDITSSISTFRVVFTP